MIAYLIDGVLLLALLLTSVRVGAMYRELKRLRSYQSQYVEVFDNTSRAADDIGSAVRHLGGEGRQILERLEAGIEEARVLSLRLEIAAELAAAPAAHAADAPDEIGTYSRKTSHAEADSLRFRNEILKFGSDNRRVQDRRDETAGGMAPSLQPQPTREFRMAPSVKAVRAANGNG